MKEQKNVLNYSRQERREKKDKLRKAKPKDKREKTKDGRKERKKEIREKQLLILHFCLLFWVTLRNCHSIVSHGRMTDEW
jgi:hypothetical protein